MTVAIVHQVGVEVIRSTSASMLVHQVAVELIRSVAGTTPPVAATRPVIFTVSG